MAKIVLILNAEQTILGSGVGGRRAGDWICVATGTRREGEQTWVVAQVTDNGPGIPATVLPRIFEPFFTTKRVGEGTGLGLSVSYGIIEQHGGRLSVESGPGRTVFALALPAVSLSESGAHPGATSEDAPRRRARGGTCSWWTTSRRWWSW